MNKNKFSLINHEGDCLWAIREDDNIIIRDQWGELVDIMTITQFCGWIDGDVGLIDSKDTTWYYTKEHRDAKPSMWKLLQFLK